jgi:hypothetical protein
MYSCTLSLNSALDGWVVNATPRALYPREREPVPIVQGLGGSQSQSERMRKISPAPGFDPRTVQTLSNLERVKQLNSQNISSFYLVVRRVQFRKPRQVGMWLKRYRKGHVQKILDKGLLERTKRRGHLLLSRC